MGKFRPGNILTFKSDTGDFLSINKEGEAILVPKDTEWEHFKLHRLMSDNKFIMESGHKLILNTTENFGDKTKTSYWKALTKNYLRSTDHHNGIDIIKINPDYIVLRNFDGMYLAIKNPESIIERKVIKTKYIDDACWFSVAVVAKRQKTHNISKLKKRKVLCN